MGLKKEKKKKIRPIYFKQIKSEKDTSQIRVLGKGKMTEMGQSTPGIAFFLFTVPSIKPESKQYVRPTRWTDLFELRQGNKVSVKGSWYLHRGEDQIPRSRVRCRRASGEIPARNRPQTHASGGRRPLRVEAEPARKEGFRFRERRRSQ